MADNIRELEIKSLTEDINSLLGTNLAVKRDHHGWYSLVNMNCPEDSIDCDTNTPSKVVDILDVVRFVSVIKFQQGL